MNTYPLGQIVVCRFAFKDSSGALVDPDLALLVVTDPTGTDTEHPLTDATHVSLGVYDLEVTGSILGRWRYAGNGDNGEQVAAAYFRIVEA